MNNRYGNGRILCFGLMVMIVGVTLTLGTSLVIKIFGLAILAFLAAILPLVVGQEKWHLSS